MEEYKSWYVENMGKVWTTSDARKQYKQGNIKTIIATIEDRGRSRVGASTYYYYNIYAIDSNGKWHRIEDDGTVPYYWSRRRRAWYNTAWGEDRLYSIVITMLDIRVGQEKVPEIVRLFGY